METTVRTTNQAGERNHLIEPSWDGNVTGLDICQKCCTSSNRTILGWKQYRYARQDIRLKPSSNRTILGWKPGATAPASDSRGKHLIEPSWDGNQWYRVVHQYETGESSSNRTILGWKPFTEDACTCNHSASNRTILGWKPFPSSTSRRSFATSNRTILGWKQVYRF